MKDHLKINWWNIGKKYSYAGFLGVITRLRMGLASLRDSPEPRPDLHLVIQGYGKEP